jgi:hypothetical protein
MTIGADFAAPPRAKSKMPGWKTAEHEALLAIKKSLLSASDTNAPRRGQRVFPVSDRLHSGPLSHETEHLSHFWQLMVTISDTDRE